MFVVGIKENQLINVGVGYRKKDYAVSVVHLPRIRKKIGGLGVRKDNILHVLLPETTTNILKYSSPCLCGSFTHASTRSSRCFLNKRYMDAVGRKHSKKISIIL